MIIGIDFDGTIVRHKFPYIGTPVPGAIETMQRWMASGHQLILWTMRSGDTLDEAVRYLQDNGIELWGINENPEQDWSESPKAYCHVYIDDAAYGCPLIRPPGERAFVDWSEVKL